MSSPERYFCVGIKQAGLRMPVHVEERTKGAESERDHNGRMQNSKKNL